MTPSTPGGLRDRLEALRRRLPPSPTDADESEPEYRTDGGPTDRDPYRHLGDVPDGAGCTEIWEHLSERGRPEGEGG